METKLFEIRDIGTFIPALAILLDSESEAERYLLSRAGFGTSKSDHREYILLSRISGGRGELICDIYDWNSRTMKYAHDYIQKMWPELKSGDVIDVEHILGERPEKKKPEREDSFL